MEASRPTCDIGATSSGHRGERDKEVEVSCTEDISTLTHAKTKRLADRYQLEVLIPNEFCRPHRPSPSYVTISEAYPKCGVRFLLNLFFREILNYYSLTVFQVTPNGWAHMIGLHGLFMECGIGPLNAMDFS